MNRAIFIHKDLKSCFLVFVRNEQAKKSLESVFSSVSEKKEIYFSILIKKKKINILVDRLKQTYF